MAVDGRPVPDPAPDSGPRSAPGRPDVPAERPEAAGRVPDSPVVAAETRSRPEYYAALRAADPDRPRGAGDGPVQGSAWAAPGLADHPARPRPESLHLPPDRAAHILDGDDTGGGHRSGTGRTGKTEFPASWSDQKVAESITDVARNPDRPPLHQAWNDRWLAQGNRDGVDIIVIARPDGRIWTAWPLEGGAGVVRNPKEAT
jgi:Bacterial EndoU nuclease